MNSDKKLIIAIMAFLVLLAPVYAQEDFKATSKKSVELCPCYRFDDSVFIENTGTEPSKYTLVMDDDYKDWVEFGFNNFILNPGEATNVNLVITSPCDAEGKHDFNVYIVTGGGLAKAISKELSFLPCYGYTVAAGELIELEGNETSIKFEEHEGSYEVCEGGKATIPVLIRNTAQIENEYSFELTGADFASLSVDAAVLPANKKGVILVNIDEAELGDYNLSFISKSKYGEAMQRLNLDLKVEDCYDINVDFLDNKDDICGCEESRYVVNVKNNGRFEEQIDFFVEGADWADVNESSVFLEAGDKAWVELIVEPDCEEEGQYTITFEGVGEEVEDSDVIVLDVTPIRDCYDAEISVSSVIRTDYSGIIVPVKVSNKGTRKAVYEVYVDAPRWISVVPDSIEVNPGKKGNVNLKVMPTSMIDEGIYVATINVDKDGVVYSKTVDVQLKEIGFFGKIGKWFKYWQYYIYTAIVLLIVLIIVIRPIMRSIEISKIRRREQEESEKKKKKGRKEIKAKKEIKEEVKVGKKYIRVLAVFFILILIAVIYGIIYKAGLVSGLRNLFVDYWAYFLVGVLALIVVLYLIIKKKGKKEIKKKAQKKVKRNYGKILKIFVVLLVLASVIFVFFYYQLYDYFRDFFVMYVGYFIAGVIILIVIIFLILFYKPLVELVRKD